MTTYLIKSIDQIEPDLDFDCADEDINHYFNNIYDHSESLDCTPFFLFLDEIFVGFFTLSCSKGFVQLDDSNGGKSWGAILLGQLGIQKNLKNQNHGTFLLNYAKYKAKNISKELAARLLILKTYNLDIVDSFYKKNGFVEFNRKKSYVEMMYDLKKWPEEEQEFIKKYNIINEKKGSKNKQK